MNFGATGDYSDFTHTGLATCACPMFTGGSQDVWRADSGIGTPVTTGVPTTSSIGTGATFSNQDVNGLLIGNKWNVTSLTFSFPTEASNYGGGYGSGEPGSGFQAFSAAQQDVARYALGLVSQYTLLSFTEITETDSTHANVRFAGSTVPSTSWAYYPANTVEGGDVWLGNIRNTAPTKAGYAFDTILHEIGHTLGLKHGHEAFSSYGVLPASHNSTEWSIMTYKSYIGADNFYRNAEGSGNQTYMIDDIAALQYLYGANFSTNAGTTVYSWSPTTGEMFINGVGQGASSANKIYLAIWDGGGIDYYDLSNYSTNLTVDLRPGEWSTFSTAQLADLDGGSGLHLAHGNVANAHLYNNDARSLIENVFGGSASDMLIGNQADNILIGNDGNDTLLGNAGNDTLSGGNGDDIFKGGAGDDFLSGGEGVDTADYSSATAGVSVNLLTSAPIGGGEGADSFMSIENVIGSSFNDVLNADGSANVLSGGAGNDTLNAGSGDDTVKGGAGDDILDGGNGIDTADFSDATGGVSVNLTLVGAQAIGGGLGSDTLSLIENLIGSSFNDTLIGDGNANILRGGAGDDSLAGGAGVDTADYSDATGGVFVALYKQTWVVNAQATGGAGTDTLTGIEKLVGGAFNDVLLGSTGDDPIQGGAGNDMLESFAGNDVLYGQDGNDELYGEEGDDYLNGGAGADFLSGGLNSDELRGGDGLDILSGGAGNDALYGDVGTDHLFGGTGDDLIHTGEGTGKLVFGEEGDDIIYFDGTGAGEVQGGDGADWIQILGTGRADIFGEGGDDVLKGSVQSDYISAGTGDDILYGNGGDDRLIGGDGADRIYAGAGNDYLWGGAGADKFYFLDGFSAGQIDTLRDFEDGVDTIYLPSALSGAVTIGTSSFGTYVTVATGQGNIAILIEDVTPSHITLGADIQFV